MWKRARGEDTLTVIYNGEVCGLTGLHYKKLPWHVVGFSARESLPATGFMTSPLSSWRCPACLRFRSSRHYHRDAPGLERYHEPLQSNRGSTFRSIPHLQEHAFLTTGVILKLEGLRFDPLIVHGVLQEPSSNIFKPYQLERPQSWPCTLTKEQRG